MCWGCVVDYYSEAGLSERMALQDSVGIMDDPVWGPIVANIAALYQQEDAGTGGPLHVIVDDTNVDDETLDAHRDASVSRWATEYYLPETLALSAKILDALKPLPVHIRALVCECGSGEGYRLQGEKS